MNGISISVSHLMTNTSLIRTTVVLFFSCLVDREFFIVPKDINPKVDVIALPEFEFSYDNVTIYYISHFDTESAFELKSIIKKSLQ